MALDGANFWAVLGPCEASGRPWAHWGRFGASWGLRPRAQQRGALGRLGNISRNINMTRQRRSVNGASTPKRQRRPGVSGTHPRRPAVFQTEILWPTERPNPTSSLGVGGLAGEFLSLPKPPPSPATPPPTPSPAPGRGGLG
eukprot:3500783-Pyramimonas_sp.AAC.1